MAPPRLSPTPAPQVRPAMRLERGSEFGYLSRTMSGARASVGNPGSCYRQHLPKDLTESPESGRRGRAVAATVQLDTLGYLILSCLRVVGAAASDVLSLPKREPQSLIPAHRPRPDSWETR